uniref:Prepro crustacean hyperglycemic hormone pericardial organ isoform n=1 Tax=Potamon ibericum TaxID=348689 RepID=Q2VF25_9EUCA|nr:prepro crustacean hyperglycemic hormone pericardial organ isoform [Potamon ibericum]
MVTSRMTAVVMAVAALSISLTMLPDAHARSAEGFGRMERLLTSLRGVADSSTPLGDLREAEEGAGHSLEKRQIYDRSCKGVYDRSLFSKLEHVCDDCYNLYRTSYVASACRSNCFESEVFDECVYQLLLPDQYLRIRDALRG